MTLLSIDSLKTAIPLPLSLDSFIRWGVYLGMLTCLLDFEIDLSNRNNKRPLIFNPFCELNHSISCYLINICTNLMEEMSVCMRAGFAGILSSILLGSCL